MSADGRGVKIRAVVVDDERLARSSLTVLLRRDPEIEIVGECGSGAEALEMIRAVKPDLVFLDVQMPECDGFDVLELLGGDLPAAVVFVTAHDQYALRAYKNHSRGQIATQKFKYVKAIAFGHLHIEEYQIGLYGANHLQSFGAGTTFADDLNLRIATQQNGKAAAGEGLVVHDDGANLHTTLVRRHDSFLPEGHGDRYLDALRLTIPQVQLKRFSVQTLQPGPHVGNPDSRAVGPVCLGEAGTVVAGLQRQHAVGARRADLNRASLSPPRDALLDRVFHPGLQNQTGKPGRKQFTRNIHTHSKASGQTHLLNFKIPVQELHFLAQRNLLAGILDHTAQQVA